MERRQFLRSIIAAAGAAAAYGAVGCGNDSGEAQTGAATTSPGVILLPQPTATPSVVPPDPPTPTIQPSPAPVVPTLGSLGRRRGLLVGGAGLDPAGLKIPRLAATAAREYTATTPNNELKFQSVHPAPGRYAFTNADTVVDFAQKNGMAVRGHVLVWHNDLPDWITQGTFTREQLISILKEHVTTLVSRYRGRVAYWDVVNEGLNDAGGLRKTIWSDTIGPDYMDMAFNWAHEADPAAKLFYNDFGAEAAGTKSEAVLSLVRSLRSRGVPIHGVGLQCIFASTDGPRPFLAKNIQRLAAAGVEVHVTELSVRIPLPSTPAKLADQARVYEEVLRACLTEPQCTAFMMWSVNDGNSPWIPRVFPGFGSATIFDEDFNPKPAYNALMNVLASA